MEDNLEEEDERTAVFSRRKLESNWDRYEELEKAEEDGDMPSQRGTDYHVLLESAGRIRALFALFPNLSAEMAQMVC